MYLSRKIDGEDPNIVFLLRCTYGTVQLLCILGILYVIRTVQKVCNSPWMKTCVVYVPSPVPPFPPPEPDAKKQYKQVKLGAHILSVAWGLLKSTAGGLCITTALHMYKGMVVGLAMQSAMGPFNLSDNKLATAVIMGKLGDNSSATWRKLRIFDEKYEGELTDKDEVLDEEGKIIVVKPISFDNLLANTWDDGEQADIEPLLAKLTKENINKKTAASGWTPIMIMASIGVEDTHDALMKMKELGADPSITDKEKWNALHWVAFHGCVKGAQFLMKEFAGKGLEDAKDKDGKVALDLAKDEKNEEVAKIIQEATRKTQ